MFAGYVQACFFGFAQVDGRGVRPGRSTLLVRRSGSLKLHQVETKSVQQVRLQTIRVQWRQGGF